MKFGAINKIVIVSALLIGMVQSAFADSYWRYNGSIVRLVANGSERTFYYKKPTVKVQKLGVGDGTILFEGYRKGNTMQGTAHAYPFACGDGGGMQYTVKGNIAPSETKIVMSGLKNITCGNPKMTTDTLVCTYLYSD